VEVLSSFLLSESLSRGKMLGNTIFQRAREVVPASADPYAGLRDDPGLRSILTSSLLGESVTYAAILNVEDVVIASGDASLVGRKLPPAEDLEPIADGNVIAQLRVIYSEGRTLEVRQPLTLATTCRSDRSASASPRC
jgi:hypothetical protein